MVKLFISVMLISLLTFGCSIKQETNSGGGSNNQPTGTTTTTTTTENPPAQ